MSDQVSFVSEYPVLIKCNLTYLSVIDSEIHLTNDCVTILILRFRNTSSNNFNSLHFSILYMSTFFK